MFNFFRHHHEIRDPVLPPQDFTGSFSSYCSSSMKELRFFLCDERYQRGIAEYERIVSAQEPSSDLRVCGDVCAVLISYRSIDGQI